jgi:acetylglutamate kinase
MVIKVGGEIVRDPSLPDIASDIAELSRSGVPIVMVHGGGPQATALQKRLGQQPNIVAGRRITDEAALEVMKMAVAGQLNVDLCSALLAAGARPVGLHGASSMAVRAKKRPPRVVAGGGDKPIDFGFVGDVHGVNTDLLGRLLDGGYLPVLACLGGDETGAVYNINADIVANQCAKHLGAAQLLLITSAPGVLRDKDDPASRIPTLTVEQARAAIADGTVQGGMIPKLEESMRILTEDRIEAIQILGNLTRGDLCRAVEHPGEVGTALLP